MADKDAVITERVSAEVENGVVVFLIGVRINKLWKVGAWVPVFAAMSRMLNARAGPRSGAPPAS